MNLIRRTGNLYPTFMEDFFEENWSGQNNRGDTGTKVPAINVKETDDEFEIHVAAPGMDKDDFEISVDDDMLTISAEEKSQKEETDKKGNYTRREFSYTSFQRAFSLPHTVQHAKIDASYDKGLLKIKTPKKEEARPKPKKQIQIS